MILMYSTIKFYWILLFLPCSDRESELLNRISHIDQSFRVANCEIDEICLDCNDITENRRRISDMVLTCMPHAVRRRRIEIQIAFRIWLCCIIRYWTPSQSYGNSCFIDSFQRCSYFAKKRRFQAWYATVLQSNAGFSTGGRNSRKRTTFRTGCPNWENDDMD